MKTKMITTFFLFAVMIVANANNPSLLQANQASQAEDDDPAVSMIKDFYAKFLFDEFGENLETFYKDIKKYCTPKMIKQLKDDYDYDGEGYAIWDFRSYEQEGAGKSRVTNIEKTGPLNYTVYMRDMGHVYAVKVKLVQEGDKYKFDAVEPTESFPGFPVYELMGLIMSDEPLQASQLEKLGYSFVGKSNDNEKTRAWSRNCIFTEKGELIALSDGASSIICSSLDASSQASTPVLSIEVFSSEARDAMLDEIRARYMNEDEGVPIKFTVETMTGTLTVTMKETPKGWKFEFSPVSVL